jgi:hypothetical protein
MSINSNAVATCPQVFIGLHVSVAETDMAPDSEEIGKWMYAGFVKIPAGWWLC